MFSITYLLPYKQIYLGTAIIYEIPNEYHSDNIEEIVLLKFREKNQTLVSKKDILVFYPILEQSMALS